MGNATALTAPFLLKMTIDEGVLEADLDALWFAVGAIFVLQVVSSIFAYLGRWWGAQAGEEAWAYGRARVHAALHRVPLDALVSPRVGDLVARVVADTATLKTFVQSVIPTALTLVASVTATAIVIAVVEPRLLLVVVVPFPIVAGLLLVLRRRITRASRTLLDRQADLNAAVTESVAGRDAIRAYGAVEHFDRRVGDAGEAMREASLALERDQAALYPITNLILSAVLLGVLAGGGYYAIEGAISVGGLVVTYFYLVRALGPIRGANTVLFGWQRTTAALGRIDDLVVDIRTITNPRRPDGSLLEIDDVEFGWRDVETVSELTLRAEPGERIAIIGPSGVGKSTTARLILGLLRPDRGAVEFGGAPPADFESADRAGMAYLGQEPFLFSGTLRENVEFGRGLSDAHVERAVEQARVESFAAERGGLAMVIEESGRNLSGGQKKRVALARALAGRPRLLVIDQLATDLESGLVDDILTRIVEQTSATVVYFGHAVPRALQPHAVFGMEGGRLIPIEREENDAVASG